MTENIITVHYDKQASDYMKRAGENAKEADSATSPEAKQKYWNLALDYFNKAINAFDTAKAASSKPKK